MLGHSDGKDPVTIRPLDAATLGPNYTRAILTATRRCVMSVYCGTSVTRADFEVQLSGDVNIK